MSKRSLIRTFVIGIAPSLLVALVAGWLAGCQSGKHKSGGVQAVAAPSPASQATMNQLKSLAGNWEMENPEKQGEWNLASTFQVTSGGNVVREIMFPGLPHEMTNTYHLDGDSVVVTHYCAIGNQPRMRAVSNDGHHHSSNQIHFQFDSVTNFTGGDQTYMGDLLLTMNGPDSLTQNWRSYQHGKMNEDSHASFALRRQK